MPNRTIYRHILLPRIRIEPRQAILYKNRGKKTRRSNSRNNSLMYKVNQCGNRVYNSMLQVQQCSLNSTNEQ
uniref:Uncharacterized protein n=1 Tax=Arundo donax TaxID=35708 RepID=A0A0A9DGS5_ARUDO